VKPKHYILAVLVAFCWGINFSVAKIGLHYLPPMMMMGLRFACVALCLLPFYARTKIPLKNIGWMALIYGLGYHMLAFTGLSMGLPASAGIIAVQMHVPFTAVIGIYWLKDPLGGARAIGLIVAFTGIIILAGTPSVTSHLPAFMLMVLSAVCWAVYNIQVKKLGPVPVMPFLAWFSLFSAVLLVTGSLLTEENSLKTMIDNAIPISLVMLYMACLTTIVGIGLWSYLIHRYSVHQVTPFSMLAPLFGIAGAWVILGEALTLPMVAGAIVTLLGVSIIVIRRPTLVSEGTH
jgi:O-acetylserine/cysteine efflux transporter